MIYVYKCGRLTFSQHEDEQRCDGEPAFIILKAARLAGEP